MKPREKGDLVIEGYGSFIYPNDPRHPRYDPDWQPPAGVVIPPPPGPVLPEHKD